VKLVLLPQAERDLDAISEPLLGRIVKRLRLLERFPLLGARMVGPLRAYRSSVVGVFRIVYRVRDDDVVEVAYVRDCRRAPAG
jgi:plasmid stabilization system protein ParE